MATSRVPRVVALTALLALAKPAVAQEDSQASTECSEKLEIIAELVADSDVMDFTETSEIVAQANADGYPENTLGYVWCAEFDDGLAAAASDINGIDVTTAPYLAADTLPITVGEIDAKAGNNLESAALTAIVGSFDASMTDLSAVTTSEYPWSGQASINAQVPTLGEGETPPMKTGMSRVYQLPDASGADQPTLMCSCGIATSDDSAEGTVPTDDMADDDGALETLQDADSGGGDDMMAAAPVDTTTTATVAPMTETDPMKMSTEANGGTGGTMESSGGNDDSGDDDSSSGGPGGMLSQLMNKLTGGKMGGTRRHLQGIGSSGQ